MASIAGSSYVNFSGVSDPTQTNLSYSNYLARWMLTVAASTKLTNLPPSMFPSISGLSQSWNPASLFTEQNPTNAKKIAYIFGDSTAQRVPYLLTRNLDRHSWKIEMRSFPGCDLASVKTVGSKGIECRKLQSNFFGEIKKHPADLVLVTEQNGWFFNSSNQPPRSRGTVIGLKNNLSIIAAHTKRLIFLGSLPTATSLIDCIRGEKQIPPSCFANQNNFKFINTLESRLVTSAGGTYVNAASWFCSNSICPPIIAGTPVMIDGQHLTDAMSQKLSVLFGYWLWAQPWARDLL